MKPTPLNEKQTQFILNRLIPFTQNLGTDVDFLKFLKTSLKQGRYKEQTHDLETLILFAESVGNRIDFVQTLKIILKKGQYDDVDKIIIEFFIEELKEANQ